MISPLDSTQGTSIGNRSPFSFSSFDDCPSATFRVKHPFADPEATSYDQLMNQFKSPNGNLQRRGSKLNSAMPILISNPFNSETPNHCRRVQKIASATPMMMNYDFEEAYDNAEKFLDRLGLDIVTARDRRETKNTPTLKPCLRMEKACSFKIKAIVSATPVMVTQEEPAENEVHMAMPSFLANRNKLVRAKTERFKFSVDTRKPKEEEVREESFSPKSALPVGHGL